MGVRVDREGSIKRDYQTAQNVAKAGGGIKPTEISDRFYLADAVFLVALEGDAELLKNMDANLQRPAWQLFLGRKSFVPGLPVWLKDGFLPDVQNLEEALTGYPYLCAYSKLEAPSEDLRMELEVGYGQGDKVRQDQPESFDIHQRRYGLRHVVSKNVKRSELPAPKEELCIFLA
jgi:CRISPR system Cascade subunit CasD